MNVKDVKEVIQTFSDAQLTHLELKCEGFEIKLDKAQNVNSCNAQKRNLQDDSEYAQSAIVNDETASMNQTNKMQQKEQSHKVITSPIVGTFYRAESPDAKPLVEVGSYVHKGDVVCIIEAMKLMNEVEAEVEGEVVEILVDNEEMVEYNEPLIVLR